MNWIEIDKILHNLYSAWNGKDIETYYKVVDQRFKWTRSQTVVATDWIIKQRQKHDNASSSGNDVEQPAKKKVAKKDAKATTSRSKPRGVSKATGSRKSNTADGQEGTQSRDKPTAKPKRKSAANKRSSAK